jgi:hypothetical protein
MSVDFVTTLFEVHFCESWIVTWESYLDTKSNVTAMDSTSQRVKYHKDDVYYSVQSIVGPM